MPDTVVELPARPALVVVPDVEILQVGDEWPASTGPFTVTPEMIASAVDAGANPSVRSPILKLGHTGRLSGGMPSFGRLDNLRATNEGMTLVADLVGVPAWVADVMPYAWPSRSIECELNHTTAQGRTVGMVITALSLLGIVLPAIDTLEDVRTVLTAESMEQAGASLSVEASVPSAPQGGSMPRTQPMSVAASVSTEDVRRAYYDQLGPGQDWWWIRELSIDPLELIVDDDEGGLWRVPVTITNDEVTFGEPTQVRVEYVAASRDSEASVRVDRRAITFATRDESRTPGGDRMDLTALRERLGLGAEVDDEAVLNAAATALDERDAEVGREDQPAPELPAPVVPEPVPAGSGTPEGSVLIDAEALVALQRQAADGAQALATIRARDRGAFIDTVVRAGRLAPANTRLRQTLEREFDRDPAEAQRIAAELAVVAPTVALGHESGGESIGDDASNQADASLFPEVGRMRARGAI